MCYKHTILKPIKQQKKKVGFLRFNDPMISGLFGYVFGLPSLRFFLLGLRGKKGYDWKGNQGWWRRGRSRLLMAVEGER